jgi:thiamine biosynthesis lipoprotein
MEKVTVDGGSLHLVAGMALDWGGIAKGYGVDLAAKALLDRGVKNGFINAGGDLYCWGTNPEGRPWRIGIKSPRGEGFFGVLNISGVGAATSGDYQRYFEESGVRYHHIFDPKTGYPARGKQSVTVVGPEATVCDALSTAVFVCPKPEEILTKFPDYGAIIVDENGKFCLVGKTYGVSFLR